MTRTWLNDHNPPTPGAELFRSDRPFRLWAYTVGHCTLLLRSWGPANGPETTIDVLFKPVATMKVRTTYDGLVIRCATHAEAEDIKAKTPSINFGVAYNRRFFLLESQGETDYIVSSAAGWHEGVLGPVHHSFFQEDDDPRWPTGPFFAQGNRTGWEVASAQEVVDALGAETDPSKHRDRHRTVYAVMTRGPKHWYATKKSALIVTGAGVFLNRSDAEQARDLMIQRRGVEDAWIEELPIGI